VDQVAATEDSKKPEVPSEVVKDQNEAKPEQEVKTPGKSCFP
jgi:hypothetical protein